MTPRERFIQTLTFGQPDRIPFTPGGPRESTLKRWRSEGLPDDVHWMLALPEEIGADPAESGDPQVRLEVDDGGFIPGCDHGVPADVSWGNFIEYSRRLAQMTGWL
ncbi:MAG: hypothetical protein ACOCZU_02840 [Planctomycetota bacterium]